MVMEKKWTEAGKKKNEEERRKKDKKYKFSITFGLNIRSLKCFTHPSQDHLVTRTFFITSFHQTGGHCLLGRILLLFSSNLGFTSNRLPNA
jgi:hypothetical protein